MPPKGKKRPAPVRVSADDAEIDAKLSAVDLLVSEMRSQLEAAMEPAIEEMRREVNFFLMRLPSRVKGMRMSDFMRECGGDVALLAEKERKAGKLARTVAKERLIGSGASVIPRPAPVLAAPAPAIAPALVPSSAGENDFDFSADAAPSDFPMLPARTPGGAAAVSRLAVAGGGVPFSAMKSARAPLPLGTRTPGPSFSSFLPKTPGPEDATRRPRNARRNEMVYHVLLSVCFGAALLRRFFFFLIFAYPPPPPPRTRVPLHLQS